jgi:hypothetical protein
MKSLYSYITEHFINIFPNISLEEKQKYAKQVWDILNKSYSYIKGLAGCKNYDDFYNKFVLDKDNKQLFWKLVKRGNIVTAIKIYSTSKGGRKSVASGCIDTEQGKNDLNKIIEEDMKLKERGMWSECSGRALGKYLNAGYTVIPNTMAELLINKKVEPLPDGYFYKRIIEGKVHTKLIVGYPPKGVEGEKPDEELVKYLKELGKKYEAE